MDFSDEKVYCGAKKIKYLFREKEDSSHLIVVFSGFPKQHSPALYNYVRTFEGNVVNAHRLFILDEYGAPPPAPAGCYYLGENGDLSVECSVISLILYISGRYNIDIKNIIVCGSSKGGFASLYLGIKYGFGHVVAGGAQVMLGNYLIREISVTRPVGEYISGGAESQHVTYLNNIIPNAISEVNSFPKINVHIGKGEPHYERHYLPLLNMLKIRNVEISSDIENYESHNDLTKFFPPYLLAKVKTILQGG